jgi:predicted nucleic acid-binding protein
VNRPPFFDTNVLIYAAVENDPRGELARSLVSAGGFISVQVLNEFAHTARYKLRRPWSEVIPLSARMHDRGVGIARRYGYRLWDALIIAAALEAGAHTLYSEDMHDGHAIEGLAIRNPFA